MKRLGLCFAIGGTGALFACGAGTVGIATIDTGSSSGPRPPLYVIEMAVAPGTTGGIAGFGAVDFDRDGDLDLLTANVDPDGQDDDFVSLLVQQPDESFSLAPYVFGGEDLTEGIVSLAIGDLDGDGFADLVTANEGTDDLSLVFVNGSTARYDSLKDPRATCSPTQVLVEDMDRDGVADICLAAGNGASVFFQGVAGEFGLGPSGTVPDLPEGEVPLALDAGDLDSDGDLDLVLAGNDRFFVLLQDSRRFELSARGPVSSGALARRLHLVDYDRDGDLDVASANFFNCNLTISPQDRGRFSETPTMIGDPFTTASPVDMAVADLDLDGDQDLVSANQVSDSLTLFASVSRDRFVLTGLLGSRAFTIAPVGVLVVDFDADGLEDILSVNFRDYSIFRGRRP